MGNFEENFQVMTFQVSEQNSGKEKSRLECHQVKGAQKNSSDYALGLIQIFAESAGAGRSFLESA